MTEDLRTLTCLALALSKSTTVSKYRLCRMVKEFLERGRDREILSPVIRELNRDSWIEAETNLRRVEKAGASVLSIFDPQYPPQLRAIADPPLAIYLKGQLNSGFTVAIVGTRKATHYGLSIAHDFAHALASSGAVVVSGLAYGIDAAAHSGAIRSNCYPGAAVLGSGICKITPTGNSALARALLESGGCIISEYNLHDGALKHHFPERNRIISGLADTVVVVEAELKSGALITARLGLEQGRDVLAVPGSLRTSTSDGTNMLIQTGAGLVTSVNYILNSAPLHKRNLLSMPNPKDSSKPARCSLSFSAEASLEQFDGAGLHDFDSLIERTGLSAAELSAALGELELQGYVSVYDGAYYIRNRIVDTA